MAPIDLLEAGVPETFNTTTVSGTCNQVKHTDIRSAWMTVWFHLCNAVYVWARKETEGKQHLTVCGQCSRWNLALHLPMLPSRPPGSWRPSPCVTVRSCTHRTHTEPPCFVESFSKVMPSPQNPNQHSLSVLQMCPVLVWKKKKKIYMIDIKIWMTRHKSFNLSEFSCF